MLNYLCCCKEMQHAKECCSHVVNITSDNCWIVTIVITIAVLIFLMSSFKFAENLYTEYHYWNWRKRRGY